MGDADFAGQVRGVGPFRITRLHLGSLTVPKGTPMGGTTLPVQAFLIDHPDGAVLFDTGLGEKSIQHSTGSLPPPFAGLWRML